MSKSSGSRTSRKALPRAKKPYPGFPLTPHPGGKWCKKIRGQMHYFGAWATRVNGVLQRVPGDGATEAEAAYNAVKDDLHAGRTPRVSGDGLTVATLCNHFLTAKLRKMEAGELTPRLFAEYQECTDLCVNQFGASRLVDDLAADDFAGLRATMAKKWAPVRLGNSITRTKSVFKFGYETQLMDRPARYGPEFKKPDKAVLRKHRAKKPVRIFAAEELRALIDGALVVGENGPTLVKPDPTLRAMILLGANCGFGNGDCASLMFTGTDLANGWIDFPRPKTGIGRRCPIWPETVAAIEAAVKVRTKPADYPDCGRLFLTTRGTAFISHTLIRKTEDGDGTTGGYRKDIIGIQFGKLLGRAGHPPRGRRVLFASRHTFETIAGGSKDQVVVDLIMGHTDPSMADNYRHRVEDDRLRAVVDHVRKWVFGEEEKVK